jgi:C-terminal processing protease CtpA/Prc
MIRQETTNTIHTYTHDMHTQMTCIYACTHAHTFMSWTQPSNDGKVVVMRIEEGSPAYWSDLRVGDVITDVENSAVDSTVAFQSQTWGLLGFRVLLSVMCVRI